MAENNPSQSSQSPAYLVDRILPTREVHLLGGPSGAGKTTLLLQMLDDWHAGRDVFGYHSHPVPFCYVACDRSTASIQHTLRRVGLGSVPLLSAIDDSLSFDANKLIERALDRVPDARMLVIDPLPALTPEGRINDYQTVLIFLTQLARTCQQANISIIGTGHATKVKDGEGFKNPRQRFLGSVAWGGFSDTMILIEPVKANDPTDPRRTVMLLPRNEPSQVLDYAFDSEGRLNPISSDVYADFVRNWYLLQTHGTRFTTSEIESIFLDTFGMSRATCYRWLVRLEDQGSLIKVSRGLYEIQKAQ